MAFEENHVQIFNLEPQKELRVVISRLSESVTVELVDGVAEVFGVEMLRNKVNKFSSSFAVFTWAGCVLKLEGFATNFRTVTKNSVIYDLHLRLEENRLKAHQERGSGPIILVTGPTDVGKSTLTRNLLNYASRAGRRPIFIDLDVGQSSVCIPGTLSVLPVDCPGDIVKGYNDKNLSVYFFGYNSPGFNMLLYFELISKLGKSLCSRMNNSLLTRCSGAVIDTCGWVKDQGYDAIIHAAESFHITTLIVLGDRQLYSRIKNDVPDSIDKIFFKELDGVVVRNKHIRKKRRVNLVSEYFFGPELSLKPFLFEVNYSEIEVIRIDCSYSRNGGNTYGDSCKRLSITKVPLNTKLINQVLGISYADTVDENVITTSVLGFVCVEDVNFEKHSIKILSPQDAPLPKNILIMGDITLQR